MEQWPIVYQDDILRVYEIRPPQTNGQWGSYRIVSVANDSTLSHTYQNRNWPKFLKSVKRRRIKELQRLIDNHTYGLMNRHKELDAWKAWPSK